MLERLLFLGYLIFAVADGALRGLPHPSIPHPSVPHPSVPHPSVPHPSVPHPSVPHPSVPHPSVPHPMTTLIPTPHPIRQQATLRYFRRIDELDNNIAYRPLTSDFTTDLY
jgi:hypothetical protein